MKQPLYFCSQAKTVFFASVFDANLITVHMSSNLTSYVSKGQTWLKSVHCMLKSSNGM